MNAILYLIQTVGGLCVGAMLIRLLLPLVRADFYNPVSQFFNKVTYPVLKPIHRIIPPAGRFDIAALLLVLVIQVITIQLSVIVLGYKLPLTTSLTWGALGTISLLIYIYIIGMFAVVIVSWVAPHSHHPAIRFVAQLIEPVLSPLRRIIPPIGGLDLSVMFAIIGLNVLLYLLGDIARAVSLNPTFVPGI